MNPVSPLFEAQQADRYARQSLIRKYQELTGANLIVMIDQIFPPGVTVLEELLHGIDSSKPLHLLLASPGGDGETSIRIIRSLQSRCSEFVVLIPDMAKSAATIVCLGADRLIFGPAGDLGPVDPQMRFSNGSLVSAKELVEAVDEAERRLTGNPETFPLFASLLEDVSMVMVEQARSALDRSDTLVREALKANGNRTDEQVAELARKLKTPLIEEPRSHSAVFSYSDALECGLPAEEFDTNSESWQVIWRLWTRYFALGAFPLGSTAVYEAEKASQIMGDH